MDEYTEEEAYEYAEHWDEPEAPEPYSDETWPDDTAVLVEGYSGVVFRVSHFLAGWAMCYMVGDDRLFQTDPSQLTKYEDEVCSCGQVGCGWA